MLQTVIQAAKPASTSIVQPSFYKQRINASAAPLDTTFLAFSSPSALHVQKPTDQPASNVTSFNAFVTQQTDKN